MEKNVRTIAPTPTGNTATVCVALPSCCSPSCWSDVLWGDVRQRSTSRSLRGSQLWALGRRECMIVTWPDPPSLHPPLPLHPSTPLFLPLARHTDHEPSFCAYRSVMSSRCYAYSDVTVWQLPNCCRPRLFPSSPLSGLCAAKLPFNIFAAVGHRMWLLNQCWHTEWSGSLE